MRNVFLVLAALLSGAASAAPTPAVKLEAVTVHLYLEGSGQLSSDVLSVPEFFARNFTPMGVGIPDGEKFHTFLVRLSFVAPKESYERGSLAEVRISNEQTGKVVLSRTVKGIYVGPTKRAYVPIFIEGHECEPMILEVKSADKTFKKQLPFSCGE